MILAYFEYMTYFGLGKKLAESEVPAEPPCLVGEFGGSAWRLSGGFYDREQLRKFLINNGTPSSASDYIYIIEFEQQREGARTTLLIRDVFNLEFQRVIEGP